MNVLLGTAAEQCCRNVVGGNLELHHTGWLTNFFATVLCATHDVKLVTLVTLVTLREQLSSGHNLQMEDPKVR
jgi:uncharacterized protein (DUF2237 family)